MLCSLDFLSNLDTYVLILKLNLTFVFWFVDNDNYYTQPWLLIGIYVVEHSCVCLVYI